MNILIVSQYFYPENFKVNDIAFDFVKKGHNVTVFTGKPNYPKGKFFEGYGFLKKRNEIINGVKVIRIPLFPRMDNSGKFLALNYLSFLLFSVYAIIFRVKGKYDLVFSHLPSPLTSAIPAIWLKNKFKIPLIIWVLDLWPESVTANSKIKDGIIMSFLKKTINFIYSKSDKILISSKTFEKSIIDNFGIKSDIIEYLPNWAEDIFTNRMIENAPIIEDLPKGFNVMFAGNLGESQDFEAVIEAAKLTENSGVNWILVGDGRKAIWIKNEIEKSNLKNVYLLGAFPLEMMPLFFKKADAMLVSLKNKPTFSLTVPAKIQAYMASGKMILGMLNGEGMDLINSSGVGFAVKAGHSKALAEKCKELTFYTKDEIEKIEQLSLSFYNENYAKEMLLNNLEKIFNDQIG